MFWFIYILVFLIGLVQTPIMVDLLRLLYPESKIKRLTSQLASTLLVILMCVFALTTLGLQVFYFIPLVPDVSLRTTKIICHSIFAYWIWVNMIVNYYHAIFTKPGVTTCKEADSDMAALKSVKDEQSDYKYCKKDSDKTSDDSPECSIQQMNNDKLTHTSEKGNQTSEATKKGDAHLGASSRSHYCKVCQVTVLYKDHHCPFTGNCVGLNNYSYFILTLCYASIGLGYSLFVGCLYFGECIFPATWSWLHNITSLREDTCFMVEPYTELFLPAMGGFLVLNIILLFQLFLLLSDLTTYEVLKNFWKKPVFKIGFERIRNKKYLRKESRLNVLLLSRRTSYLWFLFPVTNTLYVTINCT